MKNRQNNYAFIDSQNLNLSIRELGWKLDFVRFRVYLKEKYAVTKAFLFIGYIQGNDSLYTTLQSAGFICIFKPTLTYTNGSIKGNCDAELVLQAMIEYQKYEKAVIVTGDGDFACLVTFLQEKGRLETLISPHRKKASVLLKRALSGNIIFLNEMRDRFAYRIIGANEKAPIRDQPRT